MVSSSATVLYARVLSSLRASSVAAAAGVDAGTWASTTTPRIFQEMQGYLGGRNRGRLPFMEFDISSQTYNQEHFQGGTLTSAIRVRAHCGLRDVVAAGTLLDLMVTAAIASIRSELVDNYTAMGSDSTADSGYGAWGHFQDATLTIEQSFARSDYEVV